MNHPFKSISYDLPEDYVQFLREHADGDEHCFNEFGESGDEDEDRPWNLMGIAELQKEWEMKGVGTAANYNSLSLYVQCYAEATELDTIESDDGPIALSRVSNGFVIGDENGDYLYLDAEDNFSVWIYYQDGSDVLRVGDSFGAWRAKTN